MSELSTGLTAIARDPLRGTDNLIFDPLVPGLPVVDVIAPPPDTRADIAGILQAVQLTASSMSAMAGRIAELETHAQAFQDSNDDLEFQNRRLSEEIEDAYQQQSTLAMSLDAKHDRMLWLEHFISDQTLRATSLEQDIASTQSDLGKIAENVLTLLRSSSLNTFGRITTKVNSVDPNHVDP